MQETGVRSLGLKDSLEKEMAAHSSILAWIIPWTEELGGLQSMGLQELNTTLLLNKDTAIKSDCALYNSAPLQVKPLIKQTTEKADWRKNKIGYR